MSGDLHEVVLWECLRFFAHRDESNAAIHCGPVRYSPLTFRIAEALHELRPVGGDHDLLRTVLDHRGAYREDEGR